MFCKTLTQKELLKKLKTATKAKWSFQLTTSIMCLPKGNSNLSSSQDLATNTVPDSKWAQVSCLIYKRHQLDSGKLRLMISRKRTSCFVRDLKTSNPQFLLIMSLSPTSGRAISCDKDFPNIMFSMPL